MGINDVDLRALKRFVAVAEERSFRRAANRLRLAQPPLSRAIRELEKDVGVPLFVRTTRSVDLTPAGQVLLTEARGAIEHVEAAARRAARAGARVQRLAVAVKPGGTRLLDAIVQRYEADEDVPRVKIVVGGWGDLLPMLRDGRADIAFVSAPFEELGISCELLFAEPRVSSSLAPIASRSGGPFAERSSRASRCRYGPSHPRSSRPFARASTPRPRSRRFPLGRLSTT